MKNKIGIMIINIIYIIIGTILVLRNDISLTNIKILISTIIFVDAIILAIKSLEDKKFKILKLSNVPVVLGVIISILIITNLIKIHDIYVYLIILWLIILGITRFINGITLKKNKKEYGIVVIFYGLSEIFLGIILFINNFDGMYFNIVLGIIIIAKSIVEIMNNIVLIKEGKK